MTTKNRKASNVIKEIIGDIGLGEYLLAYRTGEELTQVEMAKKLKISKQDLCNIEKGRKLVSVDRAVQFAKLLKRSPNVFVKYALQDQIIKAKLKLKVSIKAA